MRLFQAIMFFLPLCSLVLAQSIQPSATPVSPYRRASGPLPTSIDQITDPELLAAIQDKQASRSRRRKIHGYGHEADELPLTNAERLRLNLPLKPPKRKESRPDSTSSADVASPDLEMDGDHAELGNWLEGNHSFW